MNLILCTRADGDQSILPLEDQSEESSQTIVVQVLKFFKQFLDTRPWRELGEMSMRAENILRRNHAETVADVKRLLVQSQSNQGVPGVGALVREEWRTLLR